MKPVQNKSCFNFLVYSCPVLFIFVHSCAFCCRSTRKMLRIRLWTFCWAGPSWPRPVLSTTALTQSGMNPTGNWIHYFGIICSHWLKRITVRVWIMDLSRVLYLLCTWCTLSHCHNFVFVTIHYSLRFIVQVLFECFTMYIISSFRDLGSVKIFQSAMHVQHSWSYKWGSADKII